MHPIILANRYLTLATANNKGEAWASPLAYVYDEVDKVFYFYSSADSRHCQNIVNNPKCSVCIFDSTSSSSDAEGLQFEVCVEEVHIDSLSRVMDFYFKKSFPEPEERKKWHRPVSDFTGNKGQRFYQIKPITMFINDYEDGQDYRKEIK